MATTQIYDSMASLGHNELKTRGKYEKPIIRYRCHKQKGVPCIFQYTFAFQSPDLACSHNYRKDFVDKEGSTSVVFSMNEEVGALAKALLIFEVSFKRSTLKRKCFSLAALEVVILTTSCTVRDDIFVSVHTMWPVYWDGDVSPKAHIFPHFPGSMFTQNINSPHHERSSFVKEYVIWCHCNVMIT